jgi:flagellin
MSSVINTNVASLNTQRNLSSSKAGLETSIQRLSSGLRVNSAKDDASGLAVATKMDSQVRGMNQAIRNANDAISYSQTAEGGLSAVTDSLQRMRELAVQGSNSTTDNASLAAEFSALQAEVTRVTGNTNFNGANTLAGGSLTFQVGAGTATGDKITVTATDLTAATTDTAKAAAAAIKVDTTTNAQAAITQIDAALKEINTERSNYGAVQNRFQAVISNLQISSENQASAKSRIMDADFAAESANLTRGQILQQAGTAMLAQANSAPNGVLALLRG